MSGIIYLKADVSYPVRIQYGNHHGPWQIGLTYSYVFPKLQQFLRIDSTVVSPVNSFRYITLAEIQLFNGAEQLAVDLQSRVSLNYPWYGHAPVTNCFDGDTTTICHSNAEACMNEPWLQVDFTDLVFDSIVVYNRNDCGSICSSRIVGTRIALIAGEGMVKWNSTFDSDMQKYTFESFD